MSDTSTLTSSVDEDDALLQKIDHLQLTALVHAFAETKPQVSVLEAEVYLSVRGDAVCTGCVYADIHFYHTSRDGATEYKLRWFLRLPDGAMVQVHDTPIAAPSDDNEVVVSIALNLSAMCVACDVCALLVQHAQHVVTECTSEETSTQSSSTSASEAHGVLRVRRDALVFELAADTEVSASLSGHEYPLSDVNLWLPSTSRSDNDNDYIWPIQILSHDDGTSLLTVRACRSDRDLAASVFACLSTPQRPFQTETQQMTQSMAACGETMPRCLSRLLALHLHASTAAVAPQEEDESNLKFEVCRLRQRHQKIATYLAVAVTLLQEHTHMKETEVWDTLKLPAQPPMDPAMLSSSTTGSDDRVSSLLCEYAAAMAICEEALRKQHQIEEENAHLQGALRDSQEALQQQALMFAHMQPDLDSGSSRNSSPCSFAEEATAHKFVGHPDRPVSVREKRSAYDSDHAIDMVEASLSSADEGAHKAAPKDSLRTQMHTPAHTPIPVTAHAQVHVRDDDSSEDLEEYSMDSRTCKFERRLSALERSELQYLRQRFADSSAPTVRYRSASTNTETCVTKFSNAATMTETIIDLDQLKSAARTLRVGRTQRNAQHLQNRALKAELRNLNTRVDEETEYTEETDSESFYSFTSANADTPRALMVPASVQELLNTLAEKVQLQQAEIAALRATKEALLTQVPRGHQAAMVTSKLDSESENDPGDGDSHSVASGFASPRRQTPL
ncbi:MAG: hypothetical protein MHM6MM_004391 [Cercozoa sp. M6MM]